VTALPRDRRSELKGLGDAFVSRISTWKSDDGVEDEFFYLLPEELIAILESYRCALRALEREQRFSAGELSVIAGSYRRGRRAMRSRGIRGLEERLYVAEQDTRARVCLAYQRYGVLLVSVILKITSNYGTSFRRFLLTTAILDVIFAIVNAHHLNYGSHRASLLAAVYWSTITLTTVGYGDILPSDETGAMLVACVEGATGAVLIGVLLHLLIHRLLIDEV